MSELAVARPALAIDVLREQLAPEATDIELAYFAAVCQRLDLSPWADQIVLVGRHDRRVGRKVHRHQITVAGRRALAVRTGKLAGIEGPVWCGPRERGELVWREVWDDDEPPYCARVLVHVQGWVKPANGTAKWTEFAQFDSGGALLPLWARMPSHMLGKVAESMALRRAFPDVIDPAVVEFPATPVGDDRAELDEAHAHNAIDDGAPGEGDLTDARRAVSRLAGDERRQFLDDWHIDDFNGPWPVEAVADALSRGGAR
ncbi:MAG TPA: recombinase RecT [Acidimicrobiales bacterium]|nr:recombinase RecT [Acidimicrobiales bacterium]